MHSISLKYHISFFIFCSNSLSLECQVRSKNRGVEFELATRCMREMNATVLFQKSVQHLLSISHTHTHQTHHCKFRKIMAVVQTNLSVPSSSRVRAHTSNTMAFVDEVNYGTGDLYVTEE